MLHEKSQKTQITKTIAYIIKYSLLNCFLQEKYLLLYLLYKTIEELINKNNNNIRIYGISLILKIFHTFQKIDIFLLQ